jgi:hypothetical protein
VGKVLLRIAFCFVSNVIENITKKTDILLANEQDERKIKGENTGSW